jgi:Protein of unknown function (DUF669)
MSTQLPEDFVPEKQEGNSWDLIPDGEYVAEIVEASVTQPRNGDGYYIALTWKIADGDYQGRYIWQRVTFLHSNEQAQSIGRETLKDLCVALSVQEHVEDVEVFLFKPARVKVGVERDKTGQYDDKNRIKRVLPVAPAPATQAAKPQAAIPKPAASGKSNSARPAGSAPWHQS